MTTTETIALAIAIIGSVILLATYFLVAKHYNTTQAA